MTEVAIGIDLGMTHSCMAVFENGNVSIPYNFIARKTTPSYVHIDKDGFPVIGEHAQYRTILDPKLVIFDVKRLIGRRFNDPLVQKNIKLWPFQVIDEGNIPKFSLHGKSYHPEEISAKLLEHFKSIAEDYLGLPVTKAVITVPAYFNNRQRDATKDAGKIAGLEVLQILNEPTAAAITYSYNNNKSQKTPVEVQKNLLVIDFGTKSLDVAVVTIKNHNIQIKAIGGESHLGGQDIDQNLAVYCVQEFEKQHGINLTSITAESDEYIILKRRKRLKGECERQKEHLSTNFAITIRVDSIHRDTDLSVCITRKQFEELNKNLFQKFFETVESVVRESGLRKTDIDDVIMIGGTTNILKIEELIQNHFPRGKVNHTDGIVASGAAILAASLTSTESIALLNSFSAIEINDVAPLPTGVGSYLQNFRQVNEGIKEQAIGIDLGTTYCCMAVYRNGTVEIIPNEIGQNTTPSFVRIEGDEIVVGQTAKAQAVLKPDRTVYEVKRLIGRRFQDTVVQKDAEIWPFKVIDDNGTPKVLINDVSYHPEMISAHILAHLKTCAEEFLNCDVKKAIITVPAYFNDSQRQATKDAGNIAGLEVLRIINEPTAAAIAYTNKPDAFKGGKTAVVFDFGGGTFDIVVMKIQDGNIEVKAVGGDTHLGGKDIDQNLVNYCLQDFKNKFGIDLILPSSERDDVKIARLLRRLKNECETQKEHLSSSRKVIITVDAVHAEKDLVVTMTREKLEELNNDMFQKCFEIANGVIKEAGLTNDKIDEVILVGGSSRIPKIRELVREHFPGRHPNMTIKADEAVASGAAILATLMTSTDRPTSKDIKIRDVVPLSIGIGIYTKNPRSFVFSKIIPKNTPVPCSFKKSYEFNPNDDRFINVYEGESEDPRKNHWVKRIVPKNLPQNKLGKSFDVEMSVNEEGILEVNAYITLF